MTSSSFTEETQAWFDGLAQDNSRAYFTAHRVSYDRAVQEPLSALLNALSVQTGGTAKLFRQNRDIRFSADKRPYKTNASGVISDCSHSAAVLYVAVSADGLQAATGYHGLAKDQLIRLRQALTAEENALGTGANLRVILETLRSAGLEVDTDSLKGMPRGVPKDAPNADLVRLRSLTASRFLEPERLTNENVAAWVSEVWKAAAPMNAWLDNYVGASTLPPETRGR